MAAEERAGRLGVITRGAEAIEAGVVAGMIGGVVMLTFLCTWAVATDRNVLVPLQWFGGLFYRNDALHMGFSSAFWGIAVHLGFSAALGVPLALFLGADTDPMISAVTGIVYALFAWLVLTFLILPWADPVMSRAVWENPIIWFSAHVPYGATLSLGVQLRHALADRERELEHA